MLYCEERLNLNWVGISILTCHITRAVNKTKILSCAWVRVSMKVEKNKVKEL